MEKFVVIDGNSLINRAFYGVPMLKSLSGKPCNAIFGFINAMLSVVSSEKPKYLVCVFDAGKHTFRHDIYADYKGTRDKAPDDLIVQLNDTKALLKAMGIQVQERAEIEADDIIGSLSRKFSEEFILLSGDKDLLQLVNNNTTVYLTQQKGVSNILKVNEDVLMKEFGLKPYQIIELKAIMGDSSDNIPGVLGIGKVGANKLLQDYGDLDNIYANIDRITGSTKEKLLASKDMAYLSKQLATIKLDVDLNLNLEDCELKLPFGVEAYKIMEEYNFRSILNKKELFETQTENVETKTEISCDIIEVDTEEKLENMIDSLSGKTIAVYTDNLTMNISNGETEFVLYSSGEIFNNNIAKLKKLFENDQEKICFDAKLLMHELSDYGIELNSYFDVSLAIYISNEMDAEISFDDALKMNNILTTAKAQALFKLKDIFVENLDKADQFKLYKDIELPLVEVLFNMEKTGIKIDVDQIKELSETYHKELNDLSERIYTLAGEEFNINSPKQLQVVLFEKLKIEYKGKAGTSIEVLNAIRDRHEIVPLVIRYRKIAKLISTYLDGMLNYVSSDGKVHTTFMQRTTSTGRLSSREPNLQNLPIRDEEGRSLRKMFSSSFEGGSIVSADYNQIELRLMANFSGDENMVADYLSGKDIHSATASKIFNVPIENVEHGMRRVAKSVNFGIIYGISAFGLSQNINTSPKEAGAFIKKYLEIYPKVEKYGNDCVAMAKETGYAKTMMGRIRHVPDINSANHLVRSFAERVAKNMPLQGSASDIIKIAMIKVYQRLKENNLKSKLIIQIHDELVIDCCPGESEIVKKILKEEMESVVSLTVPLIAEVSEGATLFDAK